MTRRTIEGVPDGNGLEIAVVASRFNRPIVEGLLDGALEELERCGVPDEHTLVVWVPGALEIPAAVSRLADSGRWDGVVALGCVIRGETAHFEHVSRAATSGLAAIAIKGEIAVGAGILTVENEAQARVRSGLAPDEGGGKAEVDRHRGREAARACVEMARLLSQLRDEAG
jgi:6,7-dimethyl-8-ribityllumazine synthase